MKCSVARKSLLDGLSAVGMVASSQPMGYQHVLLQAGADGFLQLECTDGAMSIRYRVPAESVDEPGVAVVPVQKLTSVTKECHTDSLQIQADEVGKTKVRSGRSLFQLLGERAEDFPTLTDFPSECAFGMDRARLLHLMAKTQFSVARERSRFAFNGARLEISGSDARMVATDGKRLATKVILIDNSDGVEASPIIPVHALQVFERVLAEEDDRIQLALDDTHVNLQTSRAFVSAPLLLGRFPDYRKVIPQDCPIRIEFDRLDLIQAFRQAALFITEETRSVRFQLENGQLSIQAQALDAGEATVELDAPDYTDEKPFTISLNPQFMADGLKVMDSDRAVIELTSPSNPVKVTGEPDFVYVVMPVTMRNG